jgi:phosphonate metabolism protein PhnN/1,5-bisphosphokinase (PRPP-forming)
MMLLPSSASLEKARLILVVGPSGAGKDALIERARLAFASNPDFVFARRIVTRPPAAEDHDTLDERPFLEAETKGAWLLSWRAHGLCYALPGALRDDLAQGRVVIANVSRGVILEAEALGFPVTVLHVIADPAILAARIGARGRESPADIRARISRAQSMHIRDARLVEIRNEGSLDHGAALFIKAIREAAAQTTARAE